MWSSNAAARSSSLFARQGLSGARFGATVLAVATALPEISTGLTSTKLGDYQLAVSDIFGGNTFLPVLFLLASLISGKPALPAAHHADVHLTALGIILTVVYMAGLVFRPPPPVRPDGRRQRHGGDRLPRRYSRTGDQLRLSADSARHRQCYQRRLPGSDQGFTIA
ncbi:hypothetical protein AB0N14_09895 [Streptomyces sp. NPDC051104]|uniref:hypothetical protein n=1 Tax=Streptomyces sp. NPDC051104 TaxID=3155044 RepID=UPI0034494B98